MLCDTPSGGFLLSFSLSPSFPLLSLVLFFSGVLASRDRVYLASELFSLIYFLFFSFLLSCLDAVVYSPLSVDDLFSGVTQGYDLLFFPSFFLFYLLFERRLLFICLVEFTLFSIL